MSALVAEPHKAEVVSPECLLLPPKKKKKSKAGAPVAKFADDYDMTETILGEGVTSVVCTAVEKATGNRFAVKVIDKGRGDIFEDQIRKELAVLDVCARNYHPNILQYIRHYESLFHFHIVFELAEGGSLLEVVSGRGTLSEREAASVVREIGKGLAFMHHRGIAHRDLKPANILCMKKNSLLPIKIADFGLASVPQLLSPRDPLPTPPAASSPEDAFLALPLPKGTAVAGSSSTAQSGWSGQTSAQKLAVTTPPLRSPVGSTEFLAPEVVLSLDNSSMSYNKKCDIWSLGVILHILLVGKPPFSVPCGKRCGFEKGAACEECYFNTLEAITEGNLDMDTPEWDDISEAAKSLLSRLLTKDPNERLSATEVLSHPWLQEADDSELKSPMVMTREFSTDGCAAFTSRANAIKRVASYGDFNESNALGIVLSASPNVMTSISKRRNRSMAESPSLPSLVSLAEPPTTPSKRMMESISSSALADAAYNTYSGSPRKVSRELGVSTTPLLPDDEDLLGEELVVQRGTKTVPSPLSFS